MAGLGIFLIVVGLIGYAVRAVHDPHKTPNQGDSHGH